MIALAPGGLAILAQSAGRTGIARRVPGEAADQQTDRGQPGEHGALRLFEHRIPDLRSGPGDRFGSGAERSCAG
jgi:hypothetical protein